MDRKEYYREYDRKRRESRKEYHQQLREANPEKYLEYSRRSYHKNKDNDTPSRSPEMKMFYAARKRATAKSIPFDIEVTDIVIEDNCPCCGEKMHRPSLDKVDPSKGYVKGNVAVICYNCNTIKSFGTSQRHRQIADWMDAFFT